MESQKEQVLDLLEKICNQTTILQLMLTESRKECSIDSETNEEIKNQNLDPKLNDQNKTYLNKQKEDPTTETTKESNSVQKSFCHRSNKSWFCWKKRGKNRSLPNEVVKNRSEVSVRPYSPSISSLPVHVTKYSSIGVQTKSTSIADTKILQTHPIPVDLLLHYKILLQISQTVDSLDAFINCIADLTNNQQRVDDIIAAAQVFYGRINQIQASTFPSTDYQRNESAAAASIDATSVENEITQSHADEISPRNDVVEFGSAASENQILKNVAADVTVQMNVARIFAKLPDQSNTRARC